MQEWIAVIFMFQCKCQQMGFFTEEELNMGFQKFQVSSVEQFIKDKSSIVEKHRASANQKQYNELIAFYFKSTTKPQQKFLKFENALSKHYLTLVLLEVAFRDQYALSNQLIEFCKQYKKQGQLSFDEWKMINMFLQKTKQVKDYNAEDAWPQIIIDFAESLTN